MEELPWSDDSGCIKVGSLQTGDESVTLRGMKDHVNIVVIYQLSQLSIAVASEAVAGERLLRTWSPLLQTKVGCPSPLDASDNSHWRR